MLYEEKAYAKLNLFLEVTGKRADGYHDLLSVMVPVGLCDGLRMEIRNAAKTEVFLTCGLDVPPEENLVVRACRAFLSRTGLSARVRIELDKHIPTGAGLGGGSSDAAAVLRVMNRHFGYVLSGPELSALGASLGADVPFCIQAETCLCRGIGDILSPVENRWDGYYLIAMGDRPIRTADAYRRLDENPGAFRPVSADPLLSWLKDPSAVRPELFNRFEDCAKEEHPEIRELQDLMFGFGAIAARMTGSGAAVFGMFDSEAQALCCRDRLSAFGGAFRPQVVRTVRPRL